MSKRYEREVEEILKEMGDFEKGSHFRINERSIRKNPWTYITEAINGKIWSLRPARVLLAGIIVLLSAWIVSSITTGGLARILGWSGLTLMITGYAMFFIRGRPVEKRWRGQPIEDRDKSWWDRLRRDM